MLRNSNPGLFAFLPPSLCQPPSSAVTIEYPAIIHCIVMDISHLREEYTQAGLQRNNLRTSPFDQFELWFEQAQKARIAEPNAMSLATVSASGMPSLRTVLLKYFDQSGFVFFTNYHSNKARDIADNPHVALMFPWVALERQVVVQGRAEKVSTSESLRYFTRRPHGSQLGAWVSQQSKVITGRKVLEQKLEEMKRKFREGKVPLPDFWGGYRVIPINIEFWQGRPNRLHDRFQYSRPSAGNVSDWQIHRLSP